MCSAATTTTKIGIRKQAKNPTKIDKDKCRMCVRVFHSLLFWKRCQSKYTLTRKFK